MRAHESAAVQCPNCSRTPPPGETLTRTANRRGLRRLARYSDTRLSQKTGQPSGTSSHRPAAAAMFTYAPDRLRSYAYHAAPATVYQSASLTTSRSPNTTSRADPSAKRAVALNRNSQSMCGGRTMNSTPRPRRAGRMAVTQITTDCWVAPNSAKRPNLWRGIRRKSLARRGGFLRQPSLRRRPRNAKPLGGRSDADGSSLGNYPDFWRDFSKGAAQALAARPRPL